MIARIRRAACLWAAATVGAVGTAAAQTPAAPAPAQETAPVPARAPVLPEKPLTSSTMPPQGRDSVGYPDVRSAFEALEKKQGVKISIQAGGWTVAEDRAAGAIWAFAPTSHPAYPSVVKRTFLTEGGAVSIDTKGICQAPKPACDKLMADFEADNRRLRESLAVKAKGNP